MQMSRRVAHVPNWSAALENLTPDQVGEVRKRLDRRVFPPGVQLYRQGERGTVLFIIESGRVRSSYVSENGKEYVSGIWQAGYVLGLISALLKTGRIQSAESIDTVVVDVLSIHDLVMLMETIPRFATNMACLLADMAMYSIVRSGPLALDSAASRMGRVLLQLASTDPAFPGGATQSIRGVTQDELAKMTGTSRPWVSQTLASFEQEGLIERKRGLITIHDIRRFEQHLHGPDGEG